MCPHWDVHLSLEFPLHLEANGSGCDRIIIPEFSCVKAIHHGAPDKTEAGISTTSRASKVMSLYNFRGSALNWKDSIWQPHLIQTVHNPKSGSIKVKEAVGEDCLLYNGLPDLEVEVKLICPTIFEKKMTPHFPLTLAVSRLNYHIS